MKLLVTLLKADLNIVRRVVLYITDEMLSNDGYDYDVIRDYIPATKEEAEAAFSFVVDEIEDDKMEIVFYRYEKWNAVHLPMRLVMDNPKDAQEILQMCECADTLCKTLSGDTEYKWNGNEYRWDIVKS